MDDMEAGRTDIIGQDWTNLMSAMTLSTPESEKRDGTKERKEDRLQDVKRLKQKDMALFGRRPETDSFYTVVCSLCGMILMPLALKEHNERRHVNSDPADKPPPLIDLDDCLNKLKSKPPKLLQAKTDKPRKGKSSSESPPDLTEDAKRCPKKARSPERMVPPELEPMLPSRPDKRKQKLVSTLDVSEPGLELQPVASALSPADKNGTSTKDLPKKQKKKSERKADKVYDPNEHCGVTNEEGKPCMRSISCKVHQVALKRAVQNRSKPYDTLTKMRKGQGSEERLKIEVKVKVEPEEPPEPVPVPVLEPTVKRLKVEEEELEVQEVQEVQDVYMTPAPSDMEAPSEAPLKELVVTPTMQWNLEVTAPCVIPARPVPHLVLDEVTWHSSHPKPMAVNTFGCRLIGGLMSTSKHLDILRRNLQSVYSPSSMRSGFNDVYTEPNSNNSSHKYIKKMPQTKTIAKQQGKLTNKRRRKNTAAPAHTTSNASDIISGVLVGNSPGTPSVAGNTASTNAALRLFQGRLPKQQTFIQLSLYPSK